MLPPSFGLPEPPWIIAHRGASATEPENTLASAQAALEQRAHMIEIDVQLTPDGELLLIHNWEIDVDGRRHVVEDTDSATLWTATGGIERDPSWPLPTLAQLLAAIPGEVALNVELKRRRADPDRLCESLLSTLGDRSRVLISSFDWELLEVVRRSRPDADLAPVGRSGPHELLRAAESLEAATVHCHRRLAFDDFVSATRAGGWPVLVYTINDAELAGTLFDRGVAGVFTDRPGELMRTMDLG